MNHAANFRNFLVKHNAYEIFCTEVLLHSNRTFEDITYKLTNFNNIIDYNLHWDSTKYGEEYWIDLNRLWNRACRLGTKFTNEYKSIW